MIKKISNGSVEYDGFCIDVLNELAKGLKFRYALYDRMLIPRK